jgi:hypothetical protein
MRSMKMPRSLLKVFPVARNASKMPARSLASTCESSGARAIHTNHGEANEFESRRCRARFHGQAQASPLRDPFDQLPQAPRDRPRCHEGTSLAQPISTCRSRLADSSEDGSTWQHVDLYDEDRNLIAVAGVRNASRHKDHPDFGSYILIDVKADALEIDEEEVGDENHRQPQGDLPRSSPHRSGCEERGRLIVPLQSSPAATDEEGAGVEPLTKKKETRRPVPQAAA